MPVRRKPHLFKDTSILRRSAPNRVECLRPILLPGLIFIPQLLPRRRPRRRTIRHFGSGEAEIGYTSRDPEDLVRPSRLSAQPRQWVRVHERVGHRQELEREVDVQRFLADGGVV